MLREISRHKGGFATATILIVVAIIGSTALWSYREALTGRTLANARLFQARAASLASIGLQAATARLREQPAAPRLSWQQRPPGARDEHVDATTRLLRTDTLPAGFSADRFIDHQHEATGTARSGLGTEVVQTMGVALLAARSAGNALPSSGCPTAEPVSIRVRIGSASAAPVAAMLVTGGHSALGIVDRTTGQILWSAGGLRELVSQQLFDARTQISGSVTALDTDSDGLHDRIYAGDQAGRIWRLDLHNGNDAEHFASGSVFADLADARSQPAFLASPDVSLGMDATRLTWLNIVIGSTGAANRLFVLRDYAARQQWSGSEHQRWRPLRAQDLHAGGPAEHVAKPPGYYLDLGAAQMFSASITIDGKVTYLLAETPVRAADNCSTQIGIGTFIAANGAAAQRTVHGILAAGNSLRVSIESSEPNHGRIRCTLADEEMAQCSGFDPLRRSWWRRGDVD